MTLIGLDLNATRARAVGGPMQAVALPLKLEGDYRELPLALSLEERTPRVGRAGASLCRRSPHLASLDFLPALGNSTVWSHGRTRLDACAALRLVFEALLPRFGRGCQGVFLTRPAYLTETQNQLLAEAAIKARWRLLGTISTPVAAVLAAHQQAPWGGLTLVVDVDGGALTWSALLVDGSSVRLLESQPAPRLARGAWLQRLLDCVAGRCVRMSRRDPRQLPDSDQALYEQLAAQLEPPARPGLVDLNIKTAHWAQHLQIHTDELAGYCAPLVQQAVARMRGFQALAQHHGPVGAVVMTDSARALPGLREAIERELDHSAQRAAPPPSASEIGDFGECLLLSDDLAAAQVHLLSGDSLAAVAHGLAGRLQRGDLATGHLEDAPLTAGPVADTGPARLSFRGQDHPLCGPTFTLGRDPNCNLVFESELYPSVSAQHCEIVLDRDVYTLHDQSRHGTLVNDRPVNQQMVALHSGDWIRLGPDGPVLRFLGQVGEHSLYTRF